MSPKRHLPILLAVLCLSAPALPVFAQDAAVTTALPASADPLTPDLSAPAPMAMNELKDISAGEDTTSYIALSNQTVTATNSGNSVNANTVNNGDINFSDGALSGFSGVGNFVTNTGNNNNLQGTISINISGLPNQ